jgi:hypothetical protein
MSTIQLDSGISNLDQIVKNPPLGMLAYQIHGVLLFFAPSIRDLQSDVAVFGSLEAESPIVHSLWNCPDYYQFLINILEFCIDPERACLFLRIIRRMSQEHAVLTYYRLCIGQIVNELEIILKDGNLSTAYETESRRLFDLTVNSLKN